MKRRKGLPTVEDEDEGETIYGDEDEDGTAMRWHGDEDEDCHGLEETGKPDPKQVSNPEYANPEQASNPGQQECHNMHVHMHMHMHRHRHRHLDPHTRQETPTRDKR